MFVGNESDSPRLAGALRVSRRAAAAPPEQANHDQGKCNPVDLSTGGRGGEESSNRSGRRGTHRTGGVMPDSRRLAGGSAAKAFRVNDKFAGPLEAAHCQNGSRRCVHKSGVICKIMRVLQPWTHMDTDFPMTLYENQFIRSYGNRCPPVSSVSKGYPVFTAKSGLSSAPFHPRTPHRFSREYPR